MFAHFAFCLFYIVKILTNREQKICAACIWHSPPKSSGAQWFSVCVWKRAALFLPKSFSVWSRCVFKSMLWMLTFWLLKPSGVFWEAPNHTHWSVSAGQFVFGDQLHSLDQIKEENPFFYSFALRARFVLRGFIAHSSLNGPSALWSFNLNAPNSYSSQETESLSD